MQALGVCSFIPNCRVKVVCLDLPFKTLPAAHGQYIIYLTLFHSRDKTYLPRRLPAGDCQAEQKLRHDAPFNLHHRKRVSSNCLTFRILLLKSTD